MTLVAFFQWWYGRGWSGELHRILDSPAGLLKGFDAGTLISTLFKPWKRISSGTFRDQSLSNKFRALLDNLVSRFVGFWMRLIVLFVVLIGAIILFIVHIIASIVWPALPLAPLLILLWGFLG